MGKRLHIRLIGAFSVIDADGARHAIPGRKDRAVLAFLAAHPGRAIARERLVELIWPEAAEGAGRGSLRQSLSAIRKIFRPFDLLTVDRDTVTLNADCADTDLGKLERQESVASQHGVAPLANGETFLDDLGGISADFDTWRTTEQSRLEVLVGNLIDGRTREAEASGDVRKGMVALSQLVALDPINEAAQRRYMRALIDLGQANAAIRQYRKLEKLLQSELGVRPDAETRALLADATAKRVNEPSEESIAQPANPPAPLIAADRRSTLVVHPFRDLSTDDELHFADGLSESIIAALSHISGLNVVTRAAPLIPGSRSEETREAAEDEKEPFELHGSVRKVGDRVRVGATLTGSHSGRVFWAETYDRQLDDIFDVQDDITHRIVVEMRIKLSEGEKIRILERYTKNVDVWARLMRADVLVNTLVEEDNIEARRLLEEAVRIDPDCAAAWGELGDSYLVDYMMGRRSLPGSEYLSHAERAAETALKVEPSFTHALNVIGLAQAFRGEFAEATATSRKALAAAPRNPEVAANCAYSLAICGHADEAQEIMQRAIDATPIPPMWYLMADGLCRYLQGRTDLAIDRFREAVRLVPDSSFARPYLIGALVDAGAVEEAEEVAKELDRLQPDFALSAWPGADFADRNLRDRLIGNLLRCGIRR